MKITISKENYLKAITEAQSEGETVIAATLTRWLNVSAPAVTMAIRRLRRDKLIDVKKGEIHLTRAGRDIANRVLVRHHLIERMLNEVFNMEWYKVHDEAERLEHAVSGDFERLLVEKLGTNHACPHGNESELDSPLQRRKRGWKTLAEVDAPAKVSVVSVYERDRQLLEFLDGLHIRPGTKLEVTARNYDDTMTLRVGRRSPQVGVAVAKKVWVQVS